MLAFLLLLTIKIFTKTRLALSRNRTSARAHTWSFFHNVTIYYILLWNIILNVYNVNYPHSHTTLTLIGRLFNSLIIYIWMRRKLRRSSHLVHKLWMRQRMKWVRTGSWNEVVNEDDKEGKHKLICSREKWLWIGETATTTQITN